MEINDEDMKGLIKQFYPKVTKLNQKAFCPSEDQLASFAEHKLKGKKEKDLISHLTVCGHCIEAIKFLRQTASEEEISVPAWLQQKVKGFFDIKPRTWQIVVKLLKDAWEVINHSADVCFTYPELAIVPPAGGKTASFARAGKMMSSKAQYNDVMATRLLREYEGWEQDGVRRIEERAREIVERAGSAVRESEGRPRDRVREIGKRAREIGKRAWEIEEMAREIWGRARDVTIMMDRDSETQEESESDTDLVDYMEALPYQEEDRKPFSSGPGILQMNLLKDTKNLETEKPKLPEGIEIWQKKIFNGLIFQKQLKKLDVYVLLTRPENEESNVFEVMIDVRGPSGTLAEDVDILFVRGRRIVEKLVTQEGSIVSKVLRPDKLKIKFNHKDIYLGQVTLDLRKEKS